MSKSKSPNIGRLYPSPIGFAAAKQCLQERAHVRLRTLDHRVSESTVDLQEIQIIVQPPLPAHLWVSREVAPLESKPLEQGLSKTNKCFGSSTRQKVSKQVRHLLQGELCHLALAAVLTQPVCHTQQAALIMLDGVR
jgi:hypothetical protein